MKETDPTIEDTGSFGALTRSAGIGKVLESIMHVGRDMLARTRPSTPAEEPAEALAKSCHELIKHRGEASGLALVNEILTDYESLDDSQRVQFFELINRQFEPDTDAINSAAQAYAQNPGFATHAALVRAVESPRQRLFRRLNMAPGGTRRLVRLRGAVLAQLPEHPDLEALDNDLRHLLIAWFNRGFLLLGRIDWDSPASLLERLVTYEAVHEINGLDDLRTRLAEDRRCFAFFHPAMPDDPVIFVQIALTKGVARAVEPLLDNNRVPGNVSECDTAMFYSISNCHDGLRGISFGNFLLKQVIEFLRKDLEHIRRYLTLSPVPDFCDWLRSMSAETIDEKLQGDLAAAQAALNAPETFDPAAASDDIRDSLLRVCAHYLMNSGNDPQAADRVARFHLGNGASLDHINWMADCSPTGIRQSAGIMVNYAYRIKDIEKNHEAFFADSEVVASSEVRKLANMR